MKKYYLIVTLIITLTSGCDRNRSPIITYGLHRSDFLEKIDAPGTVQAVKTVSIVAPRVPVSFLTVAHLIGHGSVVKKGDTICILSVPELVTRLETLKLELERTRAETTKLEADNTMSLSMLEAQIDNNAIQVALNSLDSVQQKFATPLKQKLINLELEKANVEKSKLKKKYTSLKKISETDSRKMKSRIMVSENQIKILTDQINSLTLLAPADGIVLRITSPTMMFMSSNGAGTIGGEIKVGSSVFTNMAILQMPDLREMQVMVEVPEADYKRIEKGQKVLIKVDAADYLITTGSVKRKALMGQTAQIMSQYQNQTKIKTYEVLVSVDSLHKLMTPGLSAKCQIIINNVKDTIIIPSTAIYQNDSIKTVYVSSGEKFFPVTVETGISNSSETIISKGLTGEEVIALIKPPQNLIRKSGQKEDDKSTNALLNKMDSLNKGSLK